MTDLVFTALHVDYDRYMTEQRYEASRQTIGELLSATTDHICVPEWQRNYSWTLEQIQGFWNDLRDFERKYPDDNLKGQEYFLGSIVLVTAKDSLIVLDGQQRLATSTILLAALRDACKTVSVEAAQQLQSQYIRSFNYMTKETEYFLTLNNYDREFFQEMVQDEPSAGRIPPRPRYTSHTLIMKAMEYFNKRVTESRLTMSDEAYLQWNLRIQLALTHHMSVIAIRSSDEANAATVFETLNDRGIGLSTPDLLRNLLLREAPDKTSRARMVDSWEEILGIGDHGVSVDQFLRHYWVSTHGDVKSRALFREIKNSMQTDGTDVVTFCDDLANAARAYTELVQADVDRPRLAEILIEIDLLNARVLYPLLLSAHSRNLAPGKLESFASFLVKLFVRYNIIGRSESSVFESHIFACASDLRGGAEVSDVVLRLRRLSPRISDFQTSFAKARMTQMTTVRYILTCLENCIRSTDELDIAGPSRVHVEHIYPQTPSAGRCIKQHADAVNRLGNLTLLSGKINMSAKNGDFVTKRKRYAESGIMLTRALTDYRGWGLAEIEDRQLELAKIAAEVWKFDDEVIPPLSVKFMSAKGADGFIVSNQDALF